MPDGIPEDEEEHCLTLQSSTSDVIVGAMSVACVVIERNLNDTVIVNWEDSEYSANEGHVVSVCVVNLNKSEIALSVNISLSRGSGEYNILYLLP